ncbi:MAG: shikimate dehydrogenase [Candidatus Micrarchaeota archaeon]
MEMNSTTKLMAVIGSPIRHSLSPRIFNAALHSRGVGAAYLALEVRAEALQDAVAGLKSVGAVGFNVTLPHKETVLPRLDSIDEEAMEIGAVNTVVNTNGRLEGFNTDVAGFSKALAKLVGSTEGMHAVVLGAGGGARAVLHSLSGCRVTLLDLDFGKARKLASRVTRSKVTARKATQKNVCDAVAGADLLVNATPVGLDGKSTPVSAGLFHKGMAVFDLAYSKDGTRLVREALQEGCAAADGREMLLWQAAESFRLFTGKKAPIGVMRSALFGGKK